jgi:hypothetical protein
VTQPVEDEDEPVMDDPITDEPIMGEIVENPPAFAPQPEISSQRPVDNSSPWFGYIGVGIALVAMLIGLAGVVAAVIYFISWTQG